MVRIPILASSRVDAPTGSACVHLRPHRHPLISVLTLIAASSTGLTSITPTGSLSKIPQFMYGALDPKHAPTNLMTGVMCVEVASNASNLLMDIKPGYMLGAKPRQQAIGHCIGIFAGGLASTPLFYLLFLSDYKVGDQRPGGDGADGGQFGFPSAVSGRRVRACMALFGEGRDLLRRRSHLHGVAAIPAWPRVRAHLVEGKFPLSPISIGLGVVLPPDSTIAMFAGAAFFELMHRRYGEQPDSAGHRLWVGAHEPICAGLIAGAALLGIADILTKVFLL